METVATGLWVPRNRLTLAKRSATENSEDAENWTFSEQLGGTPGKINFATGIEKEVTTLLTASSPVRAVVPSNDSLGRTWTALGYDDSSWLQGTGGVGDDTQVAYDPYLGLDLDSPPNGQIAQPSRMNTTVYMRFPFEQAGGTFDFDVLVLRICATMMVLWPI